jgi:hypothetical protein
MPIDFERQKFFWSRVEKDGDHLIWTGSSVPRGYGTMQIGGEDVYSHRVSYCLAKNIDLKDIEDFIILRTCDRNDCVEPDHLTPKPKKTRKAKK